MVIFIVLPLPQGIVLPQNKLFLHLEYSIFNMSFTVWMIYKILLCSILFDLRCDTN